MKIVAFDLDGTTLNSAKEISERNRNALNRAAEKGVILVPATGRVRDFIPDCIKKLNSIKYIISSNGGSVYDVERDKTIYTDLIPIDKTLDILKVIKKFNLYFELYINGFAHVKEYDLNNAMEKYNLPKEKRILLTKNYKFINDYQEFLVDKKISPEKVNLIYVGEEIYQDIYDSLMSLGGLTLTSSFKNNLEINNETTTKGAALRFLANMLGIKRDDVMALGDNGNDVEMLRYAGCSVAMENAIAEAKEVAKHETAPYDEDGLAKAIERFVLT